MGKVSYSEVLSVTLFLIAPERSWGGQSFETADGKPSGQVTFESLSGPFLNVTATEGVLVCFK